MKIKLIISFLVLISNFTFGQLDCKNTNPFYTGFCSSFHPNGQVSWLKEFKQGVAVGTWMNFNEKGELIKQLNTSLKKDSLGRVHGISAPQEGFNPDNVDFKEIGEGTMELFKEAETQEENVEIFVFPEQEAKFKGNVIQFISENLVYPKTAKELGNQGRCYVKFVVEKDGSISNVSVVKSVPDCPLCDKEAIRIIQSMPKWFPAKNNGREVRSWCQLPISFVLN